MSVVTPDVVINGLPEPFQSHHEEFGVVPYNSLREFFAHTDSARTAPLRHRFLQLFSGAHMYIAHHYGSNQLDRTRVNSILASRPMTIEDVSDILQRFGFDDKPNMLAPGQPSSSSLPMQQSVVPNLAQMIHTGDLDKALTIVNNAFGQADDDGQDLIEPLKLAVAAIDASEDDPYSAIGSTSRQDAVHHLIPLLLDPPDPGGAALEESAPQVQLTTPISPPDHVIGKPPEDFAIEHSFGILASPQLGNKSLDHFFLDQPKITSELIRMRRQEIALISGNDMYLASANKYRIGRLHRFRGDHYVVATRKMGRSLLNELLGKFAIPDWVPPHVNGEDPLSQTIYDQTILPNLANYVNNTSIGELYGNLYRIQLDLDKIGLPTDMGRAAATMKAAHIIMNDNTKLFTDISDSEKPAVEKAINAIDPDWIAAHQDAA